LATVAIEGDLENGNISKMPKGNVKPPIGRSAHPSTKGPKSKTASL